MTRSLARVCLALAVIAFAAGCEPDAVPKFVTGDEVLLAPNDETALVLSGGCFREVCTYRLRLAGMKEKWVTGELGIRKKN